MFTNSVLSKSYIFKNCNNLIQSPEAIADDLCECIVGNKDKRIKRYGRLEYVCKVFSLDFSVYEKKIKDLGIQIVDPAAIKLDVRKFIETPMAFPSNGQVIAFDDSDSSAPEKKVVDAALTAHIAQDLRLYFVTHQYLQAIQKYLRKDPFIDSLCNSGDVIMYYKGSMAHRLGLSLHLQRGVDTEIIKELNKWYPCTGDNDFEIKVNPKLEKFDEIRDKIGHMLRMFMKHEEARTLLEKSIFGSDEIINIIGKSLVIEGKHYQPLLTTQRDFIIDYSPRGTPYLTYGEEQKIYTTINKTLCFPAEDGENLCAFDLYRYKMPFVLMDVDTGKVFDRVFGAEVIDISIPHKIDYKLLAFDFDNADAHFVTRELSYIDSVIKTSVIEI